MGNYKQKRGKGTLPLFCGNVEHVIPIYDRGREGMKTRPTTQETKAHRDSGGNEGVTDGTGPATPLRPQQGTTADRGSVETQHWHSDGTNSARPEHSVLSHHKYSLLPLAEPVGNISAAATKVSADGNEATETEDQDQRETDMVNRTRQCTLLARGMPEDIAEEHRPTNGSARLTRAATEGGKEGRTPHPEPRTYCAQPGAGGVPPAAAVHTPSVRPGEGGGGGDPHQSSRAGAGETVGSAQPEGGERGDPPNHSVRTSHRACRRGR